MKNTIITSAWALLVTSLSVLTSCNSVRHYNEVLTLANNIQNYTITHNEVCDEDDIECGVIDLYNVYDDRSDFWYEDFNSMDKDAHINDVEYLMERLIKKFGTFEELYKVLLNNVMPYHFDEDIYFISEFYKESDCSYFRLVTKSSNEFVDYEDCYGNVITLKEVVEFSKKNK